MEVPIPASCPGIPAKIYPEAEIQLQDKSEGGELGTMPLSLLQKLISQT